MEELTLDYHAPSHRKAVEMKMRTIKAAMDKWGLQLFPPTHLSIKALGATLKKGGYRSAESYLLHYRAECERRSFAYTPDLTRTHRDCLRSCQRGLGGAVKALGLPFERLGELDINEEGPWCAGGPVGPAAAIVAGSWFLTREVELSTTRAELVELTGQSPDDWCVQWRLPASKSDPQALGVARTHGCACAGHSVAGCPYHAVATQLARLRRLFPDRCRGQAFDMDLPLFPDVSGTPVTKEAMTATIVAAAAKLKIPLASADGSARVSGHSLRRTGAQGFARLGIDTWAIQLLGRWGSAAVLEYIQDVPLERSAAWARRAATTYQHVPLGTEGAPQGAVPVPEATQDVGLPSVALTALAELKETMSEAPPEAESLPEDKYVQSAGLVWHRVPRHGAVGPIKYWSTVCGWRFGGSDGKMQSILPDLVLHKFLCKRCLPDEHRNAKERC